MRTQLKVVWPPAILLIGDIESYTLRRGGHRTLNIPEVFGSLNDAAEPEGWSSVSECNVQV